MVKDKSTEHSGLSTVAGVKSQQHQHHAIQIIAQKVTQLYEVAKEIRSLLPTRSPGSRNKKELTSSPGMVSFTKQMRIEFPTFDGDIQLVESIRSHSASSTMTSPVIRGFSWLPITWNYGRTYISVV